MARAIRFLHGVGLQFSSTGPPKSEEGESVKERKEGTKKGRKKKTLVAASQNGMVSRT